ncbi:hypothetical protein AKJ09_06911 [Labilithrix luteola]|uniref:Type IV fimbrial biogenesis protein PilY1 n=1 Tax=Labilithrix luteola TaxID=1391654 RepID=A0A0K1Q3E5_9BACT|nr:hypothetical protein [Labilithrix luteola]AKV00248.1 hypothetical protein AKJ09_06911 [Labilithrix luteola]
MRTIPILGASSLLAALALACSEGGSTSETTDERQVVEAGVDADGIADGGTAEDADACASCEWFPPACSRGALCTVNVDALDPRTVLFALGVHDGNLTAVGTYGSIIDNISGSWRRSGVGEVDALRGIATVGGDLWVAGSVEAMFIRETSAGKTAWTEHRPGGPDYYSTWNWAVNGLFSEPAGTWVWAATATTCSPSTASDGVGLVRLRRQPEWLELEKIIQQGGLMSPCITMNALDGAGGTLWVAGDRGVVHKVTDLEATSPVVTPENSGTMRTLLGVWAEATGHVFAVGKEGTVLHRAPGGSFVSIGEGVPPVAYHAVRGTSPSDVWIAGDEGTVMHFDGQHWSRVPIAGVGNSRPTLRAIAAIAPDRVWVAGDNVLLGLAREDGRAP